MSVQSGIKTAIDAAVSASVDDAIHDFFARLQQRREQTVSQLLAQDELLIGFHMVEKPAPLLLRILPCFPKSFAEPITYLLAVTSRRLLVVQMNEDLQTGGLARAVSLGGIESVSPVGDTVTITEKSGGRHRYHCLTEDTGNCLHRDVQRARTPAPSFSAGCVGMAGSASTSS